jgi:predicted Zn-dependent protease with MMP-like domain
MRLSQEAFAEAAREAVDGLPAEFREHMRDLAVDVQDVPDALTLEELGISNPRGLLGLYRGVPLTKRSVNHLMRMPERIVLYQRNIERMCRSRDEVVEQIRRTILHEVGHHFGMDERKLRDLGY